MPETDDRDDLLDLWADHETRDFPPECEDREVAGLLCDEVWTAVTGCLIDYLETRPHLPAWRTAALGLAFGNLAALLPHLGDEGRDYFGQLHEIARIALLEINLQGEVE